MVRTVPQRWSCLNSLLRVDLSTIGCMSPRSRAWLKPLGRHAAALVASAGVALSVLPPVLAIPEADAIKKLSVIPVFVITDPNGIPLPIPREKNLVLPLYLEGDRAARELAALLQNNPNLKANVVPVPLNVMNEKVVELNKQLKDKSKPLVAPVVLNEADVKEAIAILKTEGLTEKQIQEGLNVPLFFTNPFLTINTPEGPRGVFFLSYAELQKALTGLPQAERSKLKPKVADISAVIEQITKTKEDSFVIFPTLDYFRLVQEAKAKAQSAPSAPAKPAK